MPTIRERNGRYQAIVRYKGVDEAKTFAKLTDAKSWARKLEHDADRGVAVPRAMTGTLAKLIETYEEEMWPIKKWGETKASALQLLARELDKPLSWFTKANILKYAKDLRGDGFSPSTIDKRLSYLHEVFSAAHDVWNAVTPVEAVAEAIAAGRRLKIIGDSQERDRRPTPEELEKLIAWKPAAHNSQIDLGAVVRVLSIIPLRLSELCGIQWQNLIPERRSAIIKGRKHPDILVKGARVDEVPLIDFGDVDTYKLISERPRYMDSPFPYRANSVSQLFIQACLKLKIDDLHLHDLRAHAISSLLEAEVAIPQVALLSGHKKWDVLAKHYARIKAAKVHDAIAAAETRAQPPRQRDGGPEHRPG